MHGIEDTGNPYRQRALLDSITAKQAAHRVPVDNQGRPTAAPKARTYDAHGNLTAPGGPQD